MPDLLWVLWCANRGEENNPLGWLHGHFIHAQHEKQARTKKAAWLRQHQEYVEFDFRVHQGGHDMQAQKRHAHEWTPEPDA